MKLADKIEFENMVPIKIGGTFNGYIVANIEVHIMEYEDHIDNVINIFDEKHILIGTVLNIPFIVHYKVD